MKKKPVCWLFLGLLLFAWADDLIAAETDTPDDDIAAAADNDYTAGKTADSEARVLHVPTVCGPSNWAGTETSDRSALLTSSSTCLRLPNPLYSIMSLQL
jgi:hypothetical protein